MIIGKHIDGRIILMAKQLGLRPIIKDKNWKEANISGQELNEFDDVLNQSERFQILNDALMFYCEND